MYNYNKNFNYQENRSSSQLSPTNNTKSLPKKNFKQMKTNTINSLNDVEYFLNNFKHKIKYIKLYKILK